MNPDYVRIIAASDEDRRGLFAATARRIGTTDQNVEKDFWVCWTLDAPFRRLPAEGPRLLFKGGTSLSKAFGLINRLSEDIDITVFRGDLGEPAPLEVAPDSTPSRTRAATTFMVSFARNLRCLDAHAHLGNLEFDRRFGSSGTVGAAVAQFRVDDGPHWQRPNRVSLGHLRRAA